MPGKRTIPSLCMACGKPFLALASNVARGWGRYCSQSCGRKSPRVFTFDYWAYVAKTDDASSCWIWTGGRNTAGYGALRNRQHRGKLAHRLSWEMAYGPIPDGLIVCHRCDNPACVRPDHLFLGTLVDNVVDMVNKGRQSRGAAKRNAKLSDDHVRQIKALLMQQVPRKTLAERFGVCRSTISHIATGRQWSHVV